MKFFFYYLLCMASNVRAIGIKLNTCSESHFIAFDGVAGVNRLMGLLAECITFWTEYSKGSIVFGPSILGKELEAKAKIESDIVFKKVMGEEQDWLMLQQKKLPVNVEQEQLNQLKKEHDEQKQVRAKIVQQEKDDARWESVTRLISTGKRLAHAEKVLTYMLNEAIEAKDVIKYTRVQLKFMSCSIRRGDKLWRSIDLDSPNAEQELQELCVFFLELCVTEAIKRWCFSTVI